MTKLGGGELSASVTGTAAGLEAGWDIVTYRYAMCQTVKCRHLIKIFGGNNAGWGAVGKRKVTQRLAPRKMKEKREEGGRKKREEGMEGGEIIE